MKGSRKYGSGRDRTRVAWTASLVVALAAPFVEAQVVPNPNGALGYYGAQPSDGFGSALGGLSPFGGFGPIVAPNPYNYAAGPNPTGVGGVYGSVWGVGFNPLAPSDGYGVYGGLPYPAASMTAPRGVPRVVDLGARAQPKRIETDATAEASPSEAAKAPLSVRSASGRAGTASPKVIVPHPPRD